MLVGGVAVLLLVSLTGLIIAALREDRPAAPSAAQPPPQPIAGSGTPDDNLDSRETDRAALAVKEVFPAKTLVVADGEPAYQVLKTQASTTCGTAATGEIADLLDRLGCNLVVRGTLRSPGGDHLLTAGLFNVTDAASALRVRDRLRPLIEERKGRFRGMAAGDDTTMVEKAAARVGWQTRGHYVAYCVVTRADGTRIAGDDSTARQIMYDVIELHLNRGVLNRRTAAGAGDRPTGTPTYGGVSQRATSD
ncbi:hypothetical protein [Micromonospora sp. DT31]|uniref:hypothetical protein n=1 Tax=Micromonospora sp. DT31 TaxID=3393434 RepID=UPI003CE6924C